MNFFNLFRSFPEHKDLTAALAQQQKADLDFKNELQNLIGFRKMAMVRKSDEAMRTKLEDLRNTEIKILEGQVMHINRTNGVYKDIEKLTSNHDDIAEKRNYIDKLNKTKEEKIAKRQKLEMKLTETPKSSSNYSKVKAELDEVKKEEQKILNKLERDSCVFDAAFLKYQQVVAGTVASNFADDLESLAHVASVTAEAGLVIQETAKSMEYVPEKDDFAINSEIEQLNQFINSENATETI